MARFTHRQLTVRRHLSDLAGRDLTPRAMAQAMLATLGEVVPADHGGIGTVDPGSLLLNRVLAVWPGSERATAVVDHLTQIENRDGVTPGHLVHLYFDEIYLRDPEPAMLWPSQLRAGLHALVIRRQPEKSFGLPEPFLQAALSESSRVWYEATSPAGGTLRAGLCANGRCCAALAIGRDDPAAAFKPSEVAFVRSVSPVIARGLRLALDRRAAALEAVDDVLSPGIMLVDRGCQPVYVSPAGRAWLGLIRSVEHLGEHEPSAAVLAAVAAFRTPRLAEQAGAVCIETAAGRLRVEAADGGDGQTAIILSPERPLNAPSAPPSWPLTRQERLVVSCLLVGSSSRQIADRLKLAPSTVKSHLAHIYEKLGVNGRGGLLARYLRDGLGTHGQAQGPREQM